MKMSSYALSWDNIIWLYLILFGHSIGFKKCICFEMLWNAFEDPIKRWCRAYYFPKSIMLISTNLWGLFVHLFINTGKLRSIKVNQGQLRSVRSWSALKKAQSPKLRRTKSIANIHCKLDLWEVFFCPFLHQ